MEWNQINDQEKSKPYYNNLYDFVKHEYDTTTCYPPFDKILNAFNLTPFENTKCVILGQDPYHGERQAMGLSFSVPTDVAIPRSLQNIYKEIHDEYGYPVPNNGDLTPWAKQGVLLLNSILTVRAHSPASHAACGWENYTDAMISSLNQKTTPVVFMLWGAKAKAKRELITNKQHLILQAPHPSPYSAGSGFFGCGHFKKCNEFLEAHGIEPINWQIENI